MGLTTEGLYSFINYQLCNYVDNYSIQDMDEQVCVYIYMGHVNECHAALVKNQFQESFDITFMGNEKNNQNINCFFFLFS